MDRDEQARIREECHVLKDGLESDFWAIVLAELHKMEKQALAEVVAAKDAFAVSRAVGRLIAVQNVIVLPEQLRDALVALIERP